MERKKWLEEVNGDWWMRQGGVKTIL